MGGGRQPAAGPRRAPPFHPHIAVKKRPVILLGWRADCYAAYVRPLSTVHRPAQGVYDYDTLAVSHKWPLHRRGINHERLAEASVVGLRDSTPACVRQAG